MAKRANGRWKTLTFIAGLLCDGLCAPLVFDGPNRGASFMALVEHCLAPTLRLGDIVVLQNLGSNSVEIKPCLIL